MILPGEPRYRYRCDVCGSSSTGDSADVPPVGFALVCVRPRGAVGVIAHLCIGYCLTIGADNLAKGLPPEGAPVPPHVS